VPGGLKPVRTADDVFEITVDGPAEARALAETLRAEGRAEDVVAGMDRVAVGFRPDQADAVAGWLRGIARVPAPAADAGDIIQIAVHYGGEHGPDLPDVCVALGLSVEAFIDLHTRREHRVELMGFTPGFAYVSGLPEGMEVARLDAPRPRVAAGSVGISAGFTGLYALDGPGGWPLVGRTFDALFRPDSDHPFRLAAGQRLSFRAV
jgi:5-oxoprolinase (ATP-hydrolysing) subunit B